jgi:hypothetical protein
MFQGIVAVPNLSEVDWDDDNDRVPDEARKGFPEVGEELKASLSKNAPAEIEYIVIVSDIGKVSCEVHQNEKMLGVSVRGYVATSRRVNRKEWEDSIRWCCTELEHLTWTKISGGIRCWDQFIYDRDTVNDRKSTVGVLAMWGTRSYFDARGAQLHIIMILLAQVLDIEVKLFVLLLEFVVAQIHVCVFSIRFFAHIRHIFCPE